MVLASWLDHPKAQLMLFFQSNKLHARRYGSAIALSLVLCAVCVALLVLANFPVGKGPRIAVKPIRTSLGRNAPGATARATIEIENNGDEPLVVYDLKSSCGCAPATLATPEIAPGAKGAIYVSVSMPSHAGPVMHRVMFKTNDPENSLITVPLDAVSAWPVVASPKELHFPSLQVARESRRLIELVSPTLENFEVLNVTCSTGWVSVKSHSPAALPSSRHKFTVTVAPPIDGPLAERISFHTNLTDLPVIAIPVTGEVGETSRVRPSTLMMGSCKPDSSFPYDLTVRFKTTFEPHDVVVAFGEEVNGWQNTLTSVSAVDEHTAKVTGLIKVGQSKGFQELSLTLKPSGRSDVILSVPVSAWVR